MSQPEYARWNFMLSEHQMLESFQIFFFFFEDTAK